MQIVGKVESLWRYPVKSMRGEQLEEAHAGFPGIYGDRRYVFLDAAAPKGFPFLTGREQEQMLLYRPVFRHVDAMSQPINLAEADALSPGLTPVYADGESTMVDVETPEGEKLAIDDPLLIDRLGRGLRDRHSLRLMRSDRAMTDCRPISLFSIQTAEQLSHEVGESLDKRRFRANLYLDLARGFEEDNFVGHTLRIGSRAVIAVTDRDARCKMITLDPDTGQPNPEIMRQVAKAHEGKAGIYGAVLVEGTIRSGDEVVLVDG